MPIPLKAFTERRRAGLDDSATEKLLDSDEKGHEQAPGLSANRVATALKKVLQVAGRGCKQKTKWRVLEVRQAAQLIIRASWKLNPGLANRSPI